jgi:hypothetical protein
MKAIGFITQATAIKRILDHLRRSSRSGPRPPPVRSPHIPARMA